MTQRMESFLQCRPKAPRKIDIQSESKKRRLKNSRELLVKNSVVLLEPLKA